MTTTASHSQIIGRQISLSEARTIALEILAQAESERLQLADQEAQHGIRYEEEYYD